MSCPTISRLRVFPLKTPSFHHFGEVVSRLLDRELFPHISFLPPLCLLFIFSSLSTFDGHPSFLRFFQKASSSPSLKAVQGFSSFFPPNCVALFLLPPEGIYSFLLQEKSLFFSTRSGINSLFFPPPSLPLSANMVGFHLFLPLFFCHKKEASYSNLLRKCRHSLSPQINLPNPPSLLSQSSRFKA